MLPRATKKREMSDIADKILLDCSSARIFYERVVHITVLMFLVFDLLMDWY